jgi:hypothetical protein
MKTPEANESNCPGRVTKTPDYVPAGSRAWSVVVRTRVATNALTPGLLRWRRVMLVTTLFQVVSAVAAPRRSSRPTTHLRCLPTSS